MAIPEHYDAISITGVWGVGEVSVTQVAVITPGHKAAVGCTGQTPQVYIQVMVQEVLTGGHQSLQKGMFSLNLKPQSHTHTMIHIIIIILMVAFTSILPNQIQNDTGLKALKPAANGSYLMCILLYPTIYITVQKYIYPSVIIWMRILIFLKCRWMDLYLREGGANWSTQRKRPTNQSKNRYHILEVKIAPTWDQIATLSHWRYVCLVRTHQLY